ncbi:hypothetical protein BH10PAT2_BH10PAT2_2150 [soil metagenome]
MKLMEVFRPRRKEAEVPAASTSRVKKDVLELDLPDIHTDIIEKVYDSPEMKERAYQARENFQNADEVIAVTGSFGLGDCIMELRYVLQLAKKTQKNFLIQLHPALLPLMNANQEKFPNVQFCDKVPTEKVQNKSTFLLRLTPTTRINESLNWLDWSQTGLDIEDYSEALRQKHFFDNRRKSASVADSDFFMPMFAHKQGQDTMHDIKEKAFQSNPKANQFDQMYALMSAFLGEPVTAQEIMTSSILPYDKEILEDIPQTFDFIFAPDAGERTNGQWSNKSLSPDVWSNIFARPELKGKKVGIIKGIAHPKYCQAIFQLALNNEVEVEMLNGNLNDISQQILSTKCFVGMDSGTTHLALDVSRFAKQNGRSILVKEIIDEYSASQVEEYGITDTPILRYSHPQVVASTEMDFSHLAPEEVDQIGEYFLAA